MYEEIMYFSLLFLGLGNRPILNLPDKITLPQTAVKIPTKKSVFLHNSGYVPALFTTQCEEPFATNTNKGLLEPNSDMAFDVICTPTDLTTPIFGQMFFKYNDIELTVTLECEVLEADVNFGCTSVLFDEIYMGLKDQKTFRLINK